MARILMLFLALTLVVPAGAAAQQTTTASSPTETTVTDFPGDPAVGIVEWRYSDSDSTFRITLRSEVPRRLTITSINNSTKGVSSGSISKRNIDSGETAITTVAPSGTVWLSTEFSSSNGRFVQIKATESSSNNLPTDWGTDDLAAVGIAVALVFTLAVAWQVLRARLGLGQGGERLA